jgi:tetraacyldisaccharide-1-P 4'-kinase
VLVHHGGGLFDTPGAPAGRTPEAWSPRRPDRPVAAFAGIARPADFHASLDVPVARFLALPDHAPLDEQVLRGFAGDHPLVCTPKDAARVPTTMKGHIFTRGIEVRLPSSLKARILVLSPA